MCADYDSNFDTESESELKQKSKRKDLAQNSNQYKKQKQLGFNDEYNEDNKDRRIRRNNFLSLDAYTRHKLLVNQYVLTYPGSTAKLIRDVSKDKTEYEVLKDNHRFIWNEDQEAVSWGQRLAKKYYDLLFKEYCISDMSRYKENKFGMRWRTEKEVIEGKGQFRCGAKNCDQTENLKSWEVLFSYVESGDKKSALVKLRLCEECSHKLNYRQKRNEAKVKTKIRDKNKAKSQLIASDSAVNHSQPTNSTHSQHNSETESKPSMSSNAGDIWSAPQKLPEFEKPIDDEFDDYFSDMLL